MTAADTTGAGDAFAAGWIAGRVRGLNLRACGLWGNAMGAVAAASAGRRTFERQALASFLGDHRDRARWRAWAAEFDAILTQLASVGCAWPSTADAF